MKPPTDFVRVVRGVRYSVKAATLIASDAYWDGRNWERSGRNTFLYKTPRGLFFTVGRTCWQGERDELRPISEFQAIELFEGTLSEHLVDYQTAFPDITIVDA